MRGMGAGGALTSGLDGEVEGERSGHACALNSHWARRAGPLCVVWVSFVMADAGGETGA